MEPTETARLLASVDRQHALYELVLADRAITIEDLSRRVAAGRHRTGPETLDAEVIERARIRMAHVHVPKLAANDVVSVDWEDDEVWLADGEAADDVFETARLFEEWPPDHHVRHPQ